VDSPSPPSFYYSSEYVNVVEPAADHLSEFSHIHVLVENLKYGTLKSVDGVCDWCFHNILLFGCAANCPLSNLIILNDLCSFGVSDQDTSTSFGSDEHESMVYR
jgi:hypothetical protein